VTRDLPLIIDFDKVLLLDKGRLIEYESPAKLLDDPTSRFYAQLRMREGRRLTAGAQ
jgi:ABC-type multidrug transport system fused ATPase/permease subunit